MTDRSTKERLARFMDPGAFEPVPARTKYTCKAAGKMMHDKLKVRREIALKRAGAAIRFFRKPENFAVLSRQLEEPGYDHP